MQSSLNLFGGFDLCAKDQAPVAVTLAKGKAILAFLALAPKGVVSRAELIDVFWSDRAERQASQSLRQSLLALKRDLMRGGVAALKVERHQVSLDLGQLDISALRMRELARPEAGWNRDAVLSLPEGTFLQGVAIRDPVGQAWIEDRIAEFDSIRLALLDRALQDALKIDDMLEVERLARRILTTAPAALTAHRALITAFLARGERSLAVRQSQLHRKLSGSAPSNLEILAAGGIARLAERTPDKVKRQHPDISSVRPGLLVMPFALGDSSRETGRLAEGLADDLVVDLSRLSLFAILPPGTTTSLAMGTMGSLDAARRLGVEYCLTGNVETQRVSTSGGARLRLLAMLSDVKTGCVLWAERYERPDLDTWEVRSDLSRRISSTAAHAADIAEMERIDAVSTRNRDAWTLRVLAQRSFLRYTRAANARARSLFTQAVALDPRFARAETGIGWTHLEDYCFGWSDRPTASLDAAEERARHALARDDRFYSAMHLLSYVQLCRRDYDRAADTCAKAREDNPNDPDLLLHEGYVMSCGGAPGRGVDTMMEAFAINPVHPAWYHLLAGNAALDAERHGTAIAELSRFIETQHGSVVGVKAQALRTRAAAYAMAGDLDRAVADRDIYMAANRDFSLNVFRRTYPRRDRDVVYRQADALLKVGFPE